MASKYHLKSSSFYYPNTDIPKNKFDIKNSQIIHDIEQELLIKSYEVFFDELDEDTNFDENYSTVTPEQYIQSAIECVQFADESGFEKIILDGLNKK